MKIERYNRVVETGVTAVQISDENALQVCQVYGGTVTYKDKIPVFEITASRMGKDKRGWIFHPGEWLVQRDDDPSRQSLEIWPDKEFREHFNRAP